MPDRGDISIDGAVPVGAVADDLDRVVESLKRAVRDLERGPREDPIEMSADQMREAPKRLQATAAGPTQPLREVGLGPARPAVVPETLEGLLQVMGLPALVWVNS